MPDEATEAWLEARQATREAKDALSEAKEKMREAEAHFNRCYDTERRLWIAKRDGMEYVYGKKGNLLSARVITGGEQNEG